MLTLLRHNIVGEKMPEVEADFEQLVISNTAHLCQVSQSL